MHTLRFRQIHLDFHTSPAIEGVGTAFDKKQWQEALTTGHVNSITSFAVCHHGWSYYNGKKGVRHPHLTFDLLRAQFDAAKEIDVNVPVYISAGLNNRVAYEHPEWREVGVDGRYTGWARNVVDAGFHKLCFNSPYLDYLCDLIREVVGLFPKADGIFLDIISQGQCCCRWCLETMEKHGLDAQKEEDRKACVTMNLDKYYKMTTEAAHSVSESMPVFHNSGNITRGQRSILPYFSHLELESLPTGGWGYDHFPISAKYCSNLGLDFLGMTGKFHTTWGEFGGFKHPNALRYECAAMLAYGAKCSVGDQLHPCGLMDKSTYSIVGKAYKEVEAKEPWCEGATNCADIAVLSSQAVNRSDDRHDHADTGAARVLLEGHLLFDFIDDQMDFSRYKALVLPDDLRIMGDLKAKLDKYVAAGGKLLLTGASGLSADGTSFLFDVGATCEGESPFSPDYILPLPDLRPDFVESPFVAYVKSQRVRVTSGQSLGDVYDPYFNRTFRHFCSHQHTPNRPQPSGFACGVHKGSIMYLSHPVFTLYRGYGAVAHRDYVLRCLDRLLGSGNSLVSDLPSTARVSLAEQAGNKRYILHLLYAPTISRGGALNLSGGAVSVSGFALEIIEGLLPLTNVTVELSLPKTVRKVTLEPQGVEIPFAVKNGRVQLKVDSFTCHQMVVLHY